MANQAASEKANGILPAQAIRRLIADGHIQLAEAMQDKQLQPASLDLRLGECLACGRASCLVPKRGRGQARRAGPAQDRLEAVGGARDGCVYVAPLLERLNRLDVSAAANPKSLYDGLMSSRALSLMALRRSTKCPPAIPTLYAEICLKHSPSSRRGSRLSQVRFRQGIRRQRRRPGRPAPAGEARLNGRGGHRARHRPVGRSGR